METKSPFKVSYTEGPIPGFDYNVCMWCKNSQMEATSLFNIKKESKCLPEFKRFGLVPLVPDELNPDKKKNAFESAFTSEYNHTDIGFFAPDHTESNIYKHNKTYKFFFEESDQDCLFDKCELKSEGCKWPYTATEYLEMDEAYPWTITAQTNVSEGYNTTFCVKCSNQWDSITQDEIVFTQEAATPIMIIVIIVGVVLFIGVGGAAWFGGVSVGKGKGVKTAEMSPVLEADTANTLYEGGEP